ncbi:hypothetical protein ACFVH0_11520 [Streptomyces sp. NPDC127117]|uniref:hypothetical protein n=1 Tax=Streptomyces sp. NPDC127117 TaxID=3345368 RepID=UPI00362B578E
MNRRRISAAVLLGSAVIALASATGPATAVATATTVAASGSGSGGKPCYHPDGYDHFLELDSAEVDQGDTRVNFTEVSCTYDPADEQNVKYTAIRKGSALVHAGAEVEVVGDTGNPRAVPAGWLVDHKLPNSPYFYYRADAQGLITAMREIYHP